jgi:hypothetical protein
MATEIWTYSDQRLGEFNLTGFEVETRDGVLGRVDRATKDVSGSYLVIDAGAAMPLGRRVVLPAGVVDTVDLDDRRLSVSVGRNEILSAPEFDPDRPLDQSLRERLGSHYAARGQASGAPRAAARQRPAKTTSATRQRSRGRARSAQTSEPTKEALYKQAKRLKIEGRSKMNKAQLKRAVERRK